MDVFLQRTLLFFFLIAQSVILEAKPIKPRDNEITRSLYGFFDYFKVKHSPKINFGALKVEKFATDVVDSTITINLSKPFLKLNYREDVVNELRDSIAANLPAAYKGFKPKLYVNSIPIESLVPNAYRTSLPQDTATKLKRKPPHNVVLNKSKAYIPNNSLSGVNIALWASHGYYFEPSQNSWITQRPRLFQISEDSYTLSIVYPFLAPMLERAGANVFMPRERDPQIHEVIVDFDAADETSYIEKNGRKARWRQAELDRELDTVGYAPAKQIYRTSENPFKMGSYRVTRSRSSASAFTTWLPEIPETGEYAVYVSYKSLDNSVSDAHYVVRHSGGETEFVVNQKMAGGTWVYLGTFHFNKGKDENSAAVVLSNQSDEKAHFVTADAVKFGGGVGQVERGIQKTNDQMPDPYYYTSGVPKYMEGARYWLQLAGYHDSIYAYNDNEYKSDYVGRARWVNALVEDKNVPIDFSFALHTDAGVSDTSTIGTLSIFMTNNNGKTNYTNGLSRRASRDLADLIETEVVNDVRGKFLPSWTNRGMKDDNYYEARVPNVPTSLLELLSHQNLRDMQLALDPEFKFCVARAIYKGMAKFMSSGLNKEVAIQPLAPNNFSAVFEGDGQVRLSWSPVLDSTEASAKPSTYIVYTATENNGFDNGLLVKSTHLSLPIAKDKIYRFKVSAVNDGGESFPTEILSVCKVSEEKGCVLIVNGFNRVSAPEFYNDSLFGGILDASDAGVADYADYSKSGSQYDFLKASEYKTNDEPGHGASHKNLEGQTIAGNSHNYPYIHGVSLKKLGYSFVSMSDEAFESSATRGQKFLFIDYILGLEKATQCGVQRRYKVFSDKTISYLSDYLERGGRLFVSGAYIASELYEKQLGENWEKCRPDTTQMCMINPNSAELFASKYLHFSLNSPYLSDISTLTPSLRADCPFASQYNWNKEISSSQYQVYTLDAIDRQNDGVILMRYLENGLASVIGYKGRYRTIVSCVPFESLTTEEERNSFMSGVVKWMK